MSAADHDHSPHKEKEATSLYDRKIGNQQPQVTQIAIPGD